MSVLDGGKVGTGQLLGREDFASKHFQAKILLFVLRFHAMLADVQFSQSTSFARDF